MFDFHEKRRIKSWLYSHTSIAVLFVFIIFMSISILERFEKEREMAAKRAESAAELKQMRERAATLGAKVREAESQRGLEAEIRDRYDVAKEGEQVVVIVDEAREQATTSTARPPSRPAPSFLEYLKFWQ